MYRVLLLGKLDRTAEELYKCLNRKYHVQICTDTNEIMQNMVRIMAGTLIEVGLGKREAASMTSILEAKSREAAGMMAPPEGLFLEEVYY